MLVKKIALITSTISPEHGVFALKRVNVQDRLSDYKNAFAFYCEMLINNVFDNIVFVDNSGYKLEELEKIADFNGVRSRCEFIRYKSIVSVENNRFFLEINLIDYFCKNSLFYKSSTNCIVWKITGRYLIKNISNIILAYKNKKQYDLYINHRNYPYKTVDFYLVGFSKIAYKKIFEDNIDYYRGLQDGEILLRGYLDSAGFNSLKISSRFPKIPLIIGIRGFDGGAYGGVKDLLKWRVRTFMNLIIPSLWI